MPAYDFSYARKGLAVRVAYLAAALAYRQWLRATGQRNNLCIVLCYHAVTMEQTLRFAVQMDLVAQAAVSLEDASATRRAWPGICVTFDDAFACLLDSALPATAERGIPTTVFAVSGNLGAPPRWAMEAGRPDAALRTMTAEELRQAESRFPCRIGSHTVSHRPLGTLDREAATKELRTSRATLTDILGHDVNDLALPHGSYNDETVRLARSAGYGTVLTLDEIADPSGWPDGTIGRFLVSPDMWFIEFRLTAAGAYAWLYPWRQLIRRLRRMARGRSQ